MGHGKTKYQLDGIEDIDMSEFGFEGLDNLEKLDDLEDAKDDDFDEEPPEEPKSKMGQVFQLGRHRLMCGDSTKPDDVKKLMGGVQGRPVINRPSVQCGLYREAKVADDY